ncbi:ribosome-inactivating family protein, partial [Micromonospora sp. NPDC057140]
MRTTRLRTLAAGLAGAVAAVVLVTGGTVIAPPPAAPTTTVNGTVSKPAVGTFDLDKDGVRAYENLIMLIRVQSQQRSANTPVTPAPPASDADPAGYFSVALVAGGRRIELVIRRDDLYLVGWYQADRDRAGNADVYYRFRHDRGGSPYDFRRTTQTRIVDLTFTASYLDLGYAAEKRKALNLGGGALIKALQLLSGTNGQQPNEAVVVTIQMILEAARFHPLFEHLREHWDEWGAPPPALVDLQNNWGDLSQDWWRGQDARVAIAVTYA